MFDPTYLKQIFGGDEKLVARFLELFRTEMPRQIAALEQFFNAGDWENAHVMAHTIKGQMRYIGREDLALLAQAMENAAEMRDAKTPAAHFPELKASIHAILNAI